MHFLFSRHFNFFDMLSTIIIVHLCMTGHIGFLTTLGLYLVAFEGSLIGEHFLKRRAA